jgi:3-phosphoshikimate 1-carboxyvinyltransferase
MGGHIEETEEGVSAFPSHLRGTVIDGSQCPDIIPVLTVLGALAEGTTQIIRAGRLRLKECDRLHAMTEELKALGASVKETEDGMVIQGRPFLNGGQGKSWGDHRVAMSLAVASVKCRRPLVLEGAGSVSKSYPRFWEDFRKLGGIMKEEGMPWAESGD